MRKITLTLLSLVASVSIVACGDTKTSVSGGQTAKSANVAGKTPQNGISVSEADVAEILQYLSSDELEGRNTGTVGIEKAAVYIENILRENGIEPFLETYRDSFEIKGLTGYNLIGIKEGSDPELKEEFVMIGAHYDHIGYGKPVEQDSIANGANDNASGTTAVLALAKHLSQVDTKRSILFSFFSAEEMGLVGARHLSNRLKEENLDLYVLFNIEMIGVPMTGKDYDVYLTGYQLSNLAQKFNEYTKEEVIGFLPQAQEYQLFRRSDNYPFYQDFNIPAQSISTFDFTNYDYYHHVSDEFQYMDTAHMTALIEKLIPGVIGIANDPQRSIQMIED